MEGAWRVLDEQEEAVVAQYDSHLLQAAYARQVQTLSPPTQLFQKGAVETWTATLPPPPEAAQYQPTIVMQDRAGASWRAFQQVFPDCNLMRAMCAVHVQRSLEKGIGEETKGRWNDRQTNYDLAHNDIEKLKSGLCFAGLGPIVFRLMMQKWKEFYREPDIAQAFSEVWGDCVFTRAEVNAFGIGGLAPDNNALEGKNGSQKLDTQHGRKSLENFITWFARPGGWLNNESRNDLSFGMTMHADVWTYEFFQDIRKYTTDKTPATPLSPLELAFRVRGTDTDVIPSRRIITLLLKLPGVINDRKVLRNALKKSATAGEKGWIMTFMDLARAPVEFVTAKTSLQGDGKWHFDDVIDWCTSFHLLKPISDIHMQQNIVTRLTSLPEGRRCTIDFGAFERGKLFRSCSCSTFLHVAWCFHSHLHAWGEGIITQNPRTMDRDFGKAPVGRPTKQNLEGRLGRPQNASKKGTHETDADHEAGARAGAGKKPKKRKRKRKNAEEQYSDSEAVDLLGLLASGAGGMQSETLKRRR